MSLVPTANEARNWFRHQLEAPFFFAPTQEERALNHDQHNIEGQVLDVSESGIKFSTSFELEQGDQLSFDISKDSGPVFSGVAIIVHGQEDSAYGAKFLKIKKH